MLSLLPACSFMVMEYFGIEIDVSLLIRCMALLGPCGEMLTLISD